MENGSETDSTVKVIDATSAEKSKDAKPETIESKSDDSKANNNDKIDEIKMDVDTNETEVKKDTGKEKDGEEKEKDDIKNEDETKKCDPSEELKAKIKSQVEFYFGDINMQRDKFLIEQTKLDEGWVPMKIMLNFKLLTAMSSDPEVILKALESSQLIEISKDRTRIRRSPLHPLPVFDEAFKNAQTERSVYVKGFPLVDMDIQKIKEFLKDYEPSENIVMRKYLDKTKKLQFKGSIFVQFTTLENAKAFVARESVKYGDTELIRKFSKDYMAEKAKEVEERKQKKNEQKDKKPDKAGKEERERELETEDQDDKIELLKGSIVHFAGTGPKTSRETIKTKVLELGAEVVYIDFRMNDSEGWIRLQDENSAQVLVDKLVNQKLIVDGSNVTFRALEGEEEAKYLTNLETTIKQMRARNRLLKKSRSKRRAAGRRGRKRHGASNNDAVPSKKLSE